MTLVGFLNKIVQYLEMAAGLIFLLIKICVARSFFNPIKKKYNGTVAVLGNGPSIKEALPLFENSEEFKNIDFIAMNFFALDEVFFKIKPKHYCFMDPQFFKENVKRYDIVKIRKLFAAMQDRIDWELNLYIIDYQDGNDFLKFSQITNKSIRIKKIKYVPYIGPTFIYRNFYPKGAMFSGSNVSLLAILVAINSGYSNVMLYGVDHTFFDFVVDENNQICRKNIHFYDKGTSIIPEPLVNPDGTTRKVSAMLSIFSEAFKSHDILSNLADSLNVNIINCTKHSLINSYKRIPQNMNPCDITAILENVS